MTTLQANLPNKDGITDDIIFSLDIGTRSVIGIIGIQEDAYFRVLDMELIEHNQRAMVDGQIEDINEVARVIDLVRQRLEDRSGYKLQQVCVAAAGRTLKTCTAKYSLTVDNRAPINYQNIAELEIGAVDEACRIIDSQNEQAFDYYCVGYSVSRYDLDGYAVKNLLDHQGKVISVEIIATFLPQHVIESLYSAVQKAGLQVASLTLEPLAAMNAIIPEELRLLNLALVDIGAGTSDIAVSNEGHICAYGMADVAGDEISESIVKGLLVEFNTAELLKKQASAGCDPLDYQDILGLEHSISLAEFMKIIESAVDNLAEVISKTILEVNGRAPAAIFLVGGGSQTPCLVPGIAERLNIDNSKVAIGSNNYLKRVTVGALDIQGPQFATPLGIALTKAMKQGQYCFTVSVNDRVTRLYKKNPVTVMEVLLLSGYQHHQIMARSGRSLTYQINGQRKVLRGSPAQPAEITLNQQPVSLLNPVQPGDQLYFKPAKPGEDADLTIQEALAMTEEYRDYREQWDEEYIVEVLCNGQTTSLQAHISSMDQIELQIKKKPQKAAEDKLQVFDSNLNDIALKNSTFNNATLNITLNGKALALYQKEDKSPYIFVDLLNYVDIDLTKPQGNIVLKRNGHIASYVEELKNEDVIEIYWQENVKT